MAVAPDRPFLALVEPPAPAGGDLPRMDVAGLCGLAEAGPFDVPVCVESADAFAAVFGARSPGRLGDAVRAFFAEGGSRAWVVRAGAPGTGPARFGLGAVARAGAGVLEPAVLQARSAGTFADRVRVRAVATREPVTTWSAGDLLEVGRVVARAGAGGALEPLLTTAVPPRTPGSWTGTVGGAPARLSRRAPRDGVSVAEVVLPEAPEAGSLVVFEPDPVQRRRRRTASPPEPPTWVLVTGIASRRVRAGVVVTGRALHVLPGGTLPAVVPRAVRLGLEVDGFAGRVQDLRPDAVRFAGAREPVAPAPLPVCGAGLGAADVLVPLPFGLDPAALGPLPDPRSALERDGVPGAVADVLLDAGLAGSTVPGLHPALEARRLHGPALRGVHALADVEELTLLAVPDAVVARAGTGGPGEAPDLDVRLRRGPSAPPDGSFGRCAAAIDPPAIHDPVPVPEGARLRWDRVRGADRYELARWAGPEDDASLTTSLLAGSSITVPVPPEGWARVRGITQDGRPGTWSAGVRLARATDPAPAPPLGDAPLAEVARVHRAVLRLCAHRGDLLACLSVPPGAARPVLDGEPTGFGALAAEWPDGRPPDGVLAGLLARTAAWLAPSDRPLRSARGVAPGGPFTTTRRGVVLDGQRLLDGSPIHERRLLALLRRACLERGRRLVFEPAGPVLRRAMSRDLEALLAVLHERGAFRPERAADAFRVDVAEPAEGVVRAEVRVAPSAPLRFLVVRLERTADGEVAVA